MDNPLLKYSAKDYFFKAALCHFIVDELNAKVRNQAFSTSFLIHITHERRSHSGTVLFLIPLHLGDTR